MNRVDVVIWQHTHGGLKSAREFAPLGLDSKPPSDVLHREVWLFWFDERTHTLVLDEYTRESKASARHNWKTDASYGRLLADHYSRLSESDVPLSDGVKEAALDAFMRHLKVIRWSER